jgi:hypothetical protein
MVCCSQILTSMHVNDLVFIDSVFQLTFVCFRARGGINVHFFIVFDRAFSYRKSTSWVRLIKLVWSLETNYFLLVYYTDNVIDSKVNKCCTTVSMHKQGLYLKCNFIVYCVHTNE